MKVIILAGGLGTRISEETNTKPKPMVLLDRHPILWHLMNSFAIQGFTEFIIAAGYLGEVISSWASNLETSWNIRVLDTGQDTLTGGRIKRCIESVDDESFIATYGDGLGNVNLKSLMQHHEKMNCLATVTCVRPPARFGVLEKKLGLVTHFGEKRQSDVDWINGGYFVLERNIIDYIGSDFQSFESDVMPKITQLGQLSAYEHFGFWQPMDTLREKNELSNLAKLMPPPWLSIDK